MKAKDLSTTLLIFFLSIFCFTEVSTAENTDLTDGKLPNRELTLYSRASETGTYSLYDLKGENTILLLAFIPTINKSNEYADVMTSAFDTYVSEKLASGMMMMGAGDKDVSVMLVSNDDENTIKEYVNSMELDYPFVLKGGQELAREMGIEMPEGYNDDAVVTIIDEKNRVIYSDESYRGQGEKLKRVMYKIYDLTDVETEFTDIRYTTLFTGDKARDFAFDYVTIENGSYIPEQKYASLSDFIGKKNILLGFYPAPFSLSCAMEITEFDIMIAGQQGEEEINSTPVETEKEFNDLDILMVSDEDTGILRRWMKDAHFNNVKLISDLGAQISSMYNSYDFAFGYNKRTIFLIDTEGVIRYIDWDYQVNEEDLGLLKEEIRKLV